MIKIIIADDHAIVREGLKQIVAEEIDMEVTGEAGDAESLSDLLRNSQCDIVILDINMPGKSGMDILKDLCAEFNGIRVLMLSMYSEEQYGIRSMQAGAFGYLKKVSAPEELVKAIRKIVGGGKYVSAALADNLVKNLDRNAARLPHEKLSDREYEILFKIASGRSAEEIADELNISIHTVYSYRSRILEKMNLKTNVELTHYVLQNKLLE